MYPHINQDLCVECGVCKKVCPLQNDVTLEDHFIEPLVYALKHKSNEVRMSSASGGAYTLISDYALNASATLYGVEFDENFNVHHVSTITTTGRAAFKGSKYVQSDLEEVFIEVKRDLNDGKKVLFTGTACQVAGLRNFLWEINTDNLILNDIICHGTPSPLLWKDYLRFIQKKSKLKAYTFRSKEIGWRGFNIKAVFENGNSKLNTPDIMVYSNLFGSDLALRPSCYCCKFACIRRPSDLTIGDFWGVEKVIPKLDDNKGVSLVILSTLAGKILFEKIKDSMDYELSNTTDCLQPNLVRPTKRPTTREQFWEDYYKNGFEYLAKKYGGYGLSPRLKRFVKIILLKMGLMDVIRAMFGTYRKKREKQVQSMM